MGLHVILVGASGVGKNSILTEAKKRLDFTSTVSCTTRSPRDGEVDGVNYHFISRERFQSYIEQNLFAEWAQYPPKVGNYYGTLVADLHQQLETHERVIYDIEIQGARQIKAKFPDAIVVFVIPPSLKALRERILADPKRMHSEADLEQRLATGREEITAAYSLADHVVENDQLDRAVEHFVGFVRDCERAMRSYQSPMMSSGRNRYMLDKCLAAS
jgi:guanylate kinase